VNLKFKFKSKLHNLISIGLRIIYIIEISLPAINYSRIQA